MNVPVELETERLRLRPHQASDIPALVRLAGAREVAAMTLRIPHPYTEADARAMLERLSRETMKWFAIVLRESNELCGGIGLMMEPEHDRAEIGYWVGVPYWGKGIATEAAREVMRYGFEDLRLHRIFAICYPSNPASLHIVEKLGMKREGCSRLHVKKWGEYRDVDNYGLLADEWKAVRL